MSKMKKARQDLSKLEKYLSREVARLEKIGGRRVARKSDGKSVAGQVVKSLMARKRVAEADLARVNAEIAALDGSEESSPPEPAPAAPVAVKPAKKSRKNAAKASEDAAVQPSERVNGSDRA